MFHSVSPRAPLVVTRIPAARFNFTSSYRHSTPCSPCCCRSPDARTGEIRRTHPVNDKRPATRLLRPRRADGFHARRPSESPILPDTESSLIQPALRYLHQNLLEGGRCLSAGHLIRIAMRARLSISARLLAAFAPRRRVFSHPNVRAGRLGHRAPISSNPGQHLHQSRRPARLASWASLAVRWIPLWCDGPPSRCDGSRSRRDWLAEREQRALSVAHIAHDPARSRVRVRSAGTPTCGDRRGRPGLIPNAAAFGAAVSRRRVTRRPPVVTRGLRWS